MLSKSVLGDQREKGETRGTAKQGTAEAMRMREGGRQKKDLQLGSFNCLCSTAHLFRHAPTLGRRDEGSLINGIFPAVQARDPVEQTSGKLVLKAGFSFATEARAILVIRPWV